MLFLPKKYEYGYVGDLVSDYLKDARKNSKAIMKTDITETADAYIMEVEVPGFSKDDLDINFNDGYLVIHAKKELEENEETEKVIRKERYRGSYQRSFYLGDEYTLDDIKAKYENGELLINITKKVKPQEVQETKVSIE